MYTHYAYVRVYGEISASITATMSTAETLLRGEWEGVGVKIGENDSRFPQFDVTCNGSGTDAAAAERRVSPDEETTTLMPSRGDIYSLRDLNPENVKTNDGRSVGRSVTDDGFGFGRNVGGGGRVGRTHGARAAKKKNK